MTQVNCPWPLPASKPCLAAGEVHVWCAPLDLPENDVQRFLAILSAEERQRAHRLRLENHRRWFIVCRGVLRSILAQYVPLAAEQLQLEHGPHGKPALAARCGIPEVHFNLSNSRGLALLAVAADRGVGIDLEWIRRMANLQGLAERCLAPQEHRQWRQLPPHQQPAAFFRYWTCKEAFLKAAGWGLSFPLERICVSPAPHQPARFLSIGEDPQEAADWSLITMEPAENYAAALACRGGPPTITRWLYRQ